MWQMTEDKARDASSEPLQWIRAATALIVAIALVASFLVFVVMLNDVAETSNSEVWQRRVFLLTGLEAIVFTAVGWLFGREVNRQQVDRAQQQLTETEARAHDAEVRAVEQGTRAADLAARGDAAKAAVLARQTAFADPESGRSRSVFGDDAEAGASEFEELATFVELLFPRQ